MKKLASLFCALSLVTGLSAKVVYVASDGDNSLNGTSWEMAVADLQTAYILASAGDDIWMAGGTYVIKDGSGLLIDMKDQVNVYGSFKKGDASVDDRVRPDAANKPYEFENPTIFTTEGVELTQRPFGRSDVNTLWEGAILDGLTFQDMATSNGKLLFFQTGVTMQNCVVSRCGGSEIVLYFEGNGLLKDCLVEECYLSSGSKTFYAVRVCASKTFTMTNNVENVTFRNNKGNVILHIYNYDAGVGYNYVKNCTFDGNEGVCLSIKNDGASTPLLIDGCLFENNVYATAANTVGEGVALNGSSASATAIMNCIVRNNKNTADASADSKNAIIGLNGGSIRLADCLIHNNESSHLTVYTGGAMINNTIANNIGSVGAATNSMSSFINNLFAGNTPTEGKTMFYADSASGIELDHNAIAESDVTAESSDALIGEYVAGGELSSFVSPTSAAGLVSADEFETADFSLAASSPCINAGIWDSYYEALPSVLVGYVDGNEVFDEAVAVFEYDLAGNPRTDDGKISVGCYQGGKTSAIEKVNANGISAVVYGTDGVVVAEVEETANASVYTLTGSLVKNVALNVGTNTIPVAGNGVYVVKVGGNAYKVIVR